MICKVFIYRNSSIKPAKNVWKLLCRVISVPGSNFMFPNTWKTLGRCIYFSLTKRNSLVLNQNEMKIFLLAFRWWNKWRIALRSAGKHREVLWMIEQMSKVISELYLLGVVVWSIERLETDVKSPNSTCSPVVVMKTKKIIEIFKWKNWYSTLRRACVAAF